MTKMVREPDCFNVLGAATCKGLTGVQTPTEPDTFFLIDNWVRKPDASHTRGTPTVRKEDRAEGMR